ncbi:hypothetical protein [Acidovorax sacchari]|uniref:hypothetical protein n=1 Tax=Acidovorax sacchari TaxID=3230736 RepID=UPI0039E4968C
MIWSWFAATESHSRLSQNAAGMVENPGLSYGLFHAVAQPVYSWGVVRSVKFPGVSIDIGHKRTFAAAVAVLGNVAENSRNMEALLEE